MSQVLTQINAVNKSLAQLNTNISTLNQAKMAGGIASDIQKIAAPKFQWDAGLKQADNMVKTIQKGKLEVSSLVDSWKKGAQEIAVQQARLSKATVTPIGNTGMFKMYIPAADDVKKVTSSIEMANRTLAVHGQMLQSTGQRIQDWGKNTQWAGRQLMVGFTVPLGMAAIAAGSYSLEIDKSLTRIEKVYDGATKGLREMATNTAMDITKTIGVTVKSSLDVMAELAAAGKEGAELQALTKQAQEITVLGNVDQEKSIKSLISIQSIFQMNTKQTADAVAYLNKVDADTPTSMQDLIDAIPIAGATVAALGGTLQDTTILLTAFKEKGISTVEGANAIKTSMARIIDPTKAASEIFKEFTGKDLKKLVDGTAGKPLETFQALSDTILDSNIQLKDQESIIQSLVGKYQSVRILDLLKGLQESNGAVAKTKAISDQSAAEWSATMQKHLQAITQSASGQFNIAVESFKAEMKDFGDTALHIFTIIVNGATKFFSVFNSLPEPLKIMGTIGIGLIALSGPITMLVGLFTNMIGTVAKTAGAIMGYNRQFKALTLEQKANKLIAGEFNKDMLTQADTAQILVYQLDKLAAAYTTVNSTAAAAASQVSKASQYSGIKVNNAQVIEGPGGKLVKPGGKELTETEYAWVNQQMANKQAAAEAEKLAKQEAVVAQQAEKGSRFQAIFRSESLLAVSAVAGIVSMTAGAGSELEKWTNYISLASVALYALMPVLTKVGSMIKETSLVQGLLSSGTGIGAAITGIVSRIGPMVSGALAALVSPIGLAIGAALLTAFGLYKLITAESERQLQHMKDVTNSTDAWMNVLGKTKLTWGQIRDEAGNVKDTVDSMAQKMREGNSAIVEDFRNQTGDKLNQSVRVEAYKLQGQGLSKNDITNALNIALVAAGKKADDIQKILADLKVHLDFTGGQKDLESFVTDMQNKLKDVNSAVLNNMNFVGSDKFNANISDIKQNFLDRLAGMNDVEKAAFSKKWVDSMNKTFEDSFKKLNEDYGGKLGNNMQESINKYMTFEKGKGFSPSDAGMELDMSARNKLQDYADTQYQLAKAIAQARGASDDQLKSVKNLNDILPYLVKGNMSATDVQKSYNDAVKAAKDAGQEMSDEQKDQLAAVYASASGLDAAKIKANEYAASNKKSADAARENALGIQSLINSLASIASVAGSAASATSDFWSSMAAGSNSLTESGAGFDALGGTIQEQANKLTDATKSIYSGTMNQIYQGFADQANDQFQARLDGITKAYDARKQALENQGKMAEKAYEAKSRAFQDRWDEVMASTKKSFEDRKKTIEASAQQEADAIDAQIEGIKAQQEAEQELDDARQKQFEAEKKRVERLAELQNRNIDYARALASGNLDEAARVQNNSMALTLGWKSEDAQSAAQDAADKRTKDENKQIDALGKRKDLINEEKQAKLDALKEEQDAVENSLQKQKEMQQRAMEDARDIEKERLQNRIDSLGKEEQAAQNKERRTQEMNKRTLDIELTNLKTFIPMNEQQLNEHIGRVEGAYGQYGIHLTSSGEYWGKIIGGALQQNVDNARVQMSQESAWQQFGSTVANAISQGAFGLSLGDFFNMIITGKPPNGWKPPGASTPYSSNAQQVGGGKAHAFHVGGRVGSDFGGRLGRTGALYSDEIPAILQHGEFVVSKPAVERFGHNYLSAINSGVMPLPAFHDGGLIDSGAMGGAFTSGKVGEYLQTGMGKLGNINPKVGNSLAGMSGGFGAFFGTMMSGLMRNMVGGAIVSMGNTFLARQNQSSGISGGSYAEGKYTGPIARGVEQWRGLVLQALAMLGLDSSWADTVLRRMNQESGGNPNAINLWDDNAKRGTPSIGLMQTIGPTFNRWKSPNLPNNIYDPLANIYAGLNYAVHRYGSLSGLNRKGGYDFGGPLMPGWTSVYNGTGKPENVLSSDQQNIVIQALNKAGVIAYDNSMLSKALSNNYSINGPINQSKVDSDTASMYHYDITINATDRTDRELKTMISDAIDSKHIKNMKKIGIVR